MDLSIPKDVRSLSSSLSSSSLPTWADVLEATGIRPRPTSGIDVVSGVSLFAAGLLVGAGIGLLLAPSSGERLRQDLGERIGELRERLETGLSSSSGEPERPPQRPPQGRVA
jgi:hypothetical protein